MSDFVFPLADLNASLDIVGGKGMSLAKMARASLPVPDGFHLTTEAYRQFVAANGLQERILALLRAADPGNLAGLEQVSQEIDHCFLAAAVPPEITRAVTAAYLDLGQVTGLGPDVPVAVRSSATAEDLPGASFAGQQETYLNICGVDAVLQAIQRCWASLWTARAIAYRAQREIDPGAVALAVVVQVLVPAEASGILFTANPVSGKRDEMMITATWGLGEAIVGGLVTPDTLTLDKKTLRLVQRVTSDKQVMTVRTATGTGAGTGEQPVPTGIQKAEVLTAAQAADLARLGLIIEGLYGMPMDVEWTLAKGRFAIVQARPITSLPEPPVEWVRPHPKAIMARGSFAEFVPDAVSPLFATLAIPITEEKTQRLMTEFMGTNEKSYVFDVINGYVYMGMQFTALDVMKMLFKSTAMSVKFIKSGDARWAAARADLLDVARKWQRDVSELSAPQLLAGMREIYGATAFGYTVGQSGPIGAAPASEFVFTRFYNALVKKKSDPKPSVFLVGMESIPLRAEKSLYDLAAWTKGQPGLADYLLQTPAEAVCAGLAMDPPPAPLDGGFASRFAEHLARFGHILYDLDFAKPVPADDPAPILETLKVYLAGKGTSPYERVRAQAEVRERAETTIQQRLDPLRRRWFTKLVRWTQKCGPGREDCIADLGLGYPRLRALALELGRRLAAAGVIAHPEDVYFLEAREADALAAGLEKGLALSPCLEQVEQRKAYWQRMRNVAPPVSLPQKSFLAKFLAHDNPEGDTLKGYATSAGKVTARACVLRGPEEFGNMQPGDVIVAVTTTPAWTPLFAMASAVVTDIGGPLSHSSIVAREYGIPAVMATGVASKRIRSGQTITVDGNAGIITLQM